MKDAFARRGKRVRKPVAAPSFLGRSVEVAQVEGWLAEGTNVVTLFGPGGAGKTRLARAIADRIHASGVRPGGVHFLELGALAERREAGGALWMLAHGLGVEGGQAEIEGWLGESAPALIVLDEVDDRADEIAPWLAAWSAAYADVAWLVTSRRRLRLRDERILELVGLSRPDAVSLFFDRSKQGPVDLTAQDHKILDRLVDGVDRLPLGIELLAAQFPLRSIRELADHWLPRLPELEGTIDQPAHHRSLGAVVERSLASLPPEQAAALVDLGLLRAPFSISTAATLLGVDEDHALAALKTFREASLLRSVPALDDRHPPRHALFEVVRSVVAARLQPERREVLWPRFVAHFAERGARLADAVWYGDPGPARHELAAILPDLLSAFDDPREQRTPILRALDALLLGQGPAALHEAVFAKGMLGGDHATVYTLRARARFLRGRFHEAATDAAEAMSASVDASPTIRAEAEIAASVQARARNDGEEALRLAESSGARVRGISQEMELTASLHAASARRLLKQMPQAKAGYLSTLAKVRELGARRIEALCLANLALLAEDVGDLAEANFRGHQATELFFAIGERLLGVKCLLAEAKYSLLAGDPAGARARIEEGASLARVLGDRETAIMARILVARSLYAEGSTTLGRMEAEESLASAVELGALALAIEARALLGPDPPKQQWCVWIGPGAYWFELPESSRVELGRRPNLRRVLLALVEKLKLAPGSPLTLDELVAAGWPGEHPDPESGAQRVYTAIKTLREMGLREVLLTRDGGYLLDPQVAIRRS